MKRFTRPQLNLVFRALIVIPESWARFSGHFLTKITSLIAFIGKNPRDRSTRDFYRRRAHSAKRRGWEIQSRFAEKFRPQPDSRDVGLEHGEPEDSNHFQPVREYTWKPVRRRGTAQKVADSSADKAVAAFEI